MLQYLFFYQLYLSSQPSAVKTFSLFPYISKFENLRYFATLVLMNVSPPQVGHSWVVPTKCTLAAPLDPNTLSTPASSAQPRRTPLPWRPRRCPPPLRRAGGTKALATPPTLSPPLRGSRPHPGTTTAMAHLLSRSLVINGSKDSETENSSELLFTSLESEDLWTLWCQSHVFWILLGYKCLKSVFWLSDCVVLINVRAAVGRLGAVCWFCVPVVLKAPSESFVPTHN